MPALPPHVLLVLDAAYAEYVRRNDYEAGIELVATSAERGDDAAPSRRSTASPALRLGWMAAPAHIVDAVNRMRGPFNVNAAGDRGRHRRDQGRGPCRAHRRAQRAMAGLAHLRSCRSSASTSRRASAISCSSTFPTTQGTRPPGRRRVPVAARLILRRVAAYGFPNALRLTVGTEEANRGVVAALAEF